MHLRSLMHRRSETLVPMHRRCKRDAPKVQKRCTAGDALRAKKRCGVAEDEGTDGGRVVTRKGAEVAWFLLKKSLLLRWPPYSYQSIALVILLF